MSLYKLIKLKIGMKMQKKFIVMLLIAAFITAGIFIFGIIGYIYNDIGFFSSIRSYHIDIILVNKIK